MESKPVNKILQAIINKEQKEGRKLIVNKNIVTIL